MFTSALPKTAAFLTLFAIVASVSEAKAQSQKQINVINHLADATAVDVLCDSLTVNELLAAASMAAYKVDLSQPKFSNRLRKRLEETIASLKGIDPDLVCLSGKVLYGENGQNVPGLLEEK